MTCPPSVPAVAAYVTALLDHFEVGAPVVIEWGWANPSWNPPGDGAGGATLCRRGMRPYARNSSDLAREALALAARPYTAPTPTP